MNEMILKSKNIACKIMEEIVNKIERENLNIPDKLDMLFYISGFMNEENDLFVRAYKKICRNGNI